MQPIDDFFAFSNDDTSFVQQKKKKMKKKKRKLTSEKNADSDISNTSEIHEKSVTIGDGNKSIKPKVSLIVASPVKTVDDGVQEETELSKLLGLSKSQTAKSKLLQNHLSIGDSSFNSNSDLDESIICRDNFQKTFEQPNQQNSNLATSYPDDFLTSINSYVSEIKAKDTEIQTLLQTHQQEEININGIVYTPKTIRFELHIDIQAAGQVSGSYDLQVKGTTRISKIVNTLMPLFNKEANPKVLMSDWGKLVLYVKNLNIILSQSLKCTSLLGYRSQLATLTNGSQFEVYGIIMTEDHAKSIYSQENLKKSKKISFENITNNDSDDTFINIKIEDPQKELKSDIVDLDAQVIYDKQKHDKNGLLVLSVPKNIPVSELLVLYKYKSFLPNDLNAKLKLENTCLDPNKTLEELQIKDNETFEIDYSTNDLNELQNIIGNNGIITENDDNNDYEEEEDEEDLDYINNTKINGTENSNSENSKPNTGFVIFIVGKDKKRYMVEVRPTTKISDIAKFYKEKANLPETTNIKLVFDDEDLNFNSTVGDTELEEEFMIDVIILNKK